jgi:hypothetical protein
MAGPSVAELQDRIARLERQVADLKERLARLEQSGPRHDEHPGDRKTVREKVVYDWQA